MRQNRESAQRKLLSLVSVLPHAEPPMFSGPTSARPQGAPRGQRFRRPPGAFADKPVGQPSTRTRSLSFHTAIYRCVSPSTPPLSAGPLWPVLPSRPWNRSWSASFRGATVPHSLSSITHLAGGAKQNPRPRQKKLSRIEPWGRTESQARGIGYLRASGPPGRLHGMQPGQCSDFRRKPK